jgi:hypothetical protein
MNLLSAMEELQRFELHPNPGSHFLASAPLLA